MSDVQNLVPSSIDLLIEKYTAPEEDFELDLGGGNVLKFRVIKRKRMLDDLVAKGTEWGLGLIGLSIEARKVHVFSDVLPETLGEAVCAFMVHDLSVEPKISQRDALRMLKAPFLMRTIIAEIEAQSKSLEHIRLIELINEQKKSLNETVTEESCSAAAGDTLESRQSD